MDDVAGAGIGFSLPVATSTQRLRLMLLAACVCAIGGFGALMCARQAVADTPPDVLILVYAGPGGNDQVGLTYRSMLTRAQVHRDLQALAAGTGWTPKHVVMNAKTAAQLNADTPMTIVSFDARNVISPDSHTFTLEPVVLAMKAYPFTALTYFVAGHYNYRGLRQYQDRYVNIRLDEQTAAFTYHIHILDPSFQKLNLPIYQAPAAQSQVVSTPIVYPHKGRHRARSWQVGVVALVAIAAGGAVYFVASRQPWHSA